MNQKFYGKLLVAFLGLMLVLTIISRAADSLTVARVGTLSPKQGYLTYQTSISGSIEAANPQYIQGEPDFRITQIYAETGAKVKQGDPLFAVDTTQFEISFAEAKSQVQSKQLAMEKLQMERDGTISQQQELSNAQARLKRAQADDEIETMLNDGVQLQKTKRELEDAQAALAAIKSSIQDGKKKNNIDIKLQQLELETSRKKLDRLQAIADKGGVVASPIDGTIGQVFVQPGETPSAGSLCTIIPDGSAFIFKGEIATDEAENIKGGDVADLTPEGSNIPVPGIKLLTVQKSEDKTKVVAEIPGQPDLSYGMQAVVNHVKKSQQYDMLIPLSALYGVEGNYYVFTMGESATVLGKEQVAVQVGVEVLAKDNKNAAVKATLSMDDIIITESNKPLVEGDRVRELS